LVDESNGGVIVPSTRGGIRLRFHHNNNEAEQRCGKVKWTPKEWL
jgi:hypothetical protein